MKDSGNSIDIIPEGTTVRVIEINDDRLSVEWHGQHGRIDKNDVVSTVDAIDYYPQKISRNSNPNYDFAYYNRRVGFGKKGQSNKTLADFHQAIRLNPQDSLQHLSALAPAFFHA